MSASGPPAAPSHAGRAVRARTRPARARRALAALALAAGGIGPTAGCYSYAPVASAALAPAGQVVRVELTAVAAETLAARLGADVRAVEGHVRARDAEQVELAVTTTLLRSGGEQAWRGEVVAIPWTGVARVGERTFSRRRTALAAAALVGAATIAALAVGPDFSLAGRGRGGTGPDR